MGCPELPGWPLSPRHQVLVAIQHTQGPALPEPAAGAWLGLRQPGEKPPPSPDGFMCWLWLFILSMLFCLVAAGTAKRHRGAESA